MAILPHPPSHSTLAYSSTLPLNSSLLIHPLTQLQLTLSFYTLTLFFLIHPPTQLQLNLSFNTLTLFFLIYLSIYISDLFSLPISLPDSLSIFMSISDGLSLRISLPVSLPIHLYVFSCLSDYFKYLFVLLKVLLSTLVLLHYSTVSLLVSVFSRNPVLLLPHTTRYLVRCYLTFFHRLCLFRSHYLSV